MPWKSALPNYILQIYQGGDPNHYPPELESILARELLFKVNIKLDNIKDPEGSTYNVHKICIDDNIIKTFVGANQLNEVIYYLPSNNFFRVKFHSL